MKDTKLVCLLFLIQVATILKLYSVGMNSPVLPVINENDSTILFYDDFDDGDFTSNPAWLDIVSQACAPNPASVKVENGTLHFFQTNAKKCGTSARIETQVDISVTDSTIIRFDVNPVFSNVVGGAGYRGVEYPVIISMELLNWYGEILRLNFCYNYRGGENAFSKDWMNITFPSCEQGVWIRNEKFRIRDFFPEAVKISKLELQAIGWDYEGYADNIVIYDRLAPFAKLTMEKIDIIEKKLPMTTNDEKARLLMQLSDLYQSISLSQSITFANEALELSQATGNQTIEAAARERLNDEPKPKNMLQMALDNYKKRLETNLRLGKTKSQLYCEYFNIGEAYYEMNHYDSALHYLEMIYEFHEAGNDSEKQIKTALNYISRIHQNRREYDKAISALDTLIQVYRKTQNKNGIREVTFEKAKVYLISNRNEEAKKYFDELTALCLNSDNYELLAKANESLGDIYYQEKEFEKSIHHHQEAHQLYQKTGNIYAIAVSMYKLAGDYLKTGENSTSLKYLDKSFNLIDLKNFDNLKSAVYLKYSELYDKMGNQDLKSKYYSDYQNARNPYEREIDEEFRKLVERSKKSLMYLNIVSVMLALFVAFYFYRRYWLKRQSNLKLAEEKEQLENWNTELKIKNEMISNQNQAIEQQMKEKEILLRELHHRVKNNLQVIYSMLNIQSRQVKDPESVAVLQASINRIWAMALIHHKLYIDQNLTQIRMCEYIRDLTSNIMETCSETHNQVEIFFDLEEINLEADIAIPLGLIINEMIINAMKHAFVGTEKPVLKISFRKDNSKNLVLMVKDNGIGLPEDTISSGTGSFGIELIGLLTSQLHGELTIQNHDGACFMLIFKEIKHN